MNKWALVGNGYIAKKHIEAIKAIGDELTMVCDSDGSRSIDGLPFFFSYKEMLASPLFNSVDNVAVCTPNFTHNEITMWALHSGKRVLCEKPFVLNEKELNFYHDTRRVFLVHQLRYHPVLATIPKVAPFQANLVIKVRRDDSYWKSWKGNRELSGGIVYNLGVHYFDILIHLFGGRFKVTNSDIQERKAEGIIEFRNGYVKFLLEISEESIGERYLEINGKKYHFSNKENLSEENLHIKVYEDMKKGRGIRPNNVVTTYRLLEKL